MVDLFSKLLHLEVKVPLKCQYAVENCLQAQTTVNAMQWIKVEMGNLP